MMITLLDVFLARAKIRHYIKHTPLEVSSALSKQLKAQIFLKLENVQRTGSFKPRGAFNKLLSLPSGISQVIASTAGNHGIGLSYAAKRLGVRAEIYLPHTADPKKISLLKKNGAKLTFFDSVEDARVAAKKEARNRKIPFVSAYNDEDMIAGGGTIALEVLEDLPSLDILVCGIGGGGLMSGLGLVLKAVHPGLKIIGVQAKENALMSHWLRKGRPAATILRPTIADGLSVNMERDTITFVYLKKYVDQVKLVSEEEMRQAMIYAKEEHGMILEPSGAATIAAIRSFKGFAGKKVVGIITGGNISGQRFGDIISKI